MAALYSNTLASGANSGNLSVTANTVHSVQSDVVGVLIESLNSVSSTWQQIAVVTAANQSVSFIATSETIRARNPGTANASSARVEVF